MSEKTSSSESVSETVKPESISRPPGKGRNVLLMIVAIVIVIALIATAFVMMPESKDEVELTVEIQGPTDLEVDAGSTQNFTVVVKYGNEIVTNDSRTKLFWSVAPTDIGVLMLKGKGEVPFRAGIVAGTGAVNCTATFQETDDSDEIEVSDQKVLKVLPPFLDAVSISPVAKTIEPGKNWTFTATAVSSVGLPISGVTFEWSITSEPSGAATLSSTTGTSVTVSGSALGYANLTATGSYSGATKSGTSAIVIGYLPPRSLDTVWYDMFEVPIGPWYDARFPIYGEEEVVSHSNPSLFFYHSGDGGKYLYTLMRMNVTGENVPEINTNIRPEFLPMLSPTERGGTAKIDWYMQYLSPTEIKAQYPAFASQDDGWIVILNGTTTLDKQAAKMVLNLTETGYDNFEAWWTGNGGIVTERYNKFLIDEASDRLDIQNAYDYYLQLFTGNLKAAKVGTEIVLTYELVTWGMEALLMRWMYETILPIEMWYEDMHFRMTIGPETADVNIDTAVTYSLYATETIDSMGDPDVMPCWVFQPALGDAYESSPSHPHSDYDRYLPYSYLNRQPDSSLYGQYWQYDVVPAAWNLTESESLTIKWPVGEDVLFRWRIEQGNVINVTDTMVVSYSEPMSSDFPGQVEVNSTSGEISFVGPMNMYDWSKTQTAHEYLADEWLRLSGGEHELLPYGLPWVEFRMNEKPRQWLDHFDISIDNLAFPKNDEVTMTVTAINNWGTVYRGYGGTVNLTSSDAAASLPDNYTFLPDEKGSHNFTGIRFQTLGNQTLTATNVSLDTPLIVGVADVNVLAMRNVSSMQVDVYHLPAVGVPEDVTVTAFDQYGDLFLNYTGTVTFSSNRSVDVEVPLDYVFQLSDAGVHTIEGQLNFTAIGWFTLNVSDVDNPLAKGTQTNIQVVASPEIVDHYTMVGIRDMLTRQKSDVSVTAYNQYGMVFERYNGTIHFAANASGAVLPADYTFVPDDKGFKMFAKGVSFSSPGVFTITVSDTVVVAATGSQSNIVIQYRPAAQTFTMYDMFEEPWGEWWPWRYPGYKTDIVLNNESGKYTMLYNADGKGIQGLIYAPYRWNITATNLSQVSVHNPEFMPVLGKPNVPGAEASIDVYFQYLDRNWWNTYWKPVWNFPDSIMTAQMTDGWNPGVTYGVTMNRAAAEEWLGMPQTGVNPLTWWAMNGGKYLADWRAWIFNEGNTRLDIWAGYEWPYVDLGTKMKLQVLPDGKIYLQIASIAWGYEILITRWFNETNICNHEAYYEDLSMHVDYFSNWIDMNFDAVCQYSLRAVKANESATNEPAWAWQPQLIDYVASWNTPGGIHPSKFDPWDPSLSLVQSWNAGDPSYMGYVPYDSGWSHFNLSEYQKFVIKIPQDNDNLGYLAEPMPFDSIRRIIKGYTGTVSTDPVPFDPYPRGDGSHYNYSAYWPLMVNGTMSLGWYGNWTGDPNLDNMYDPVSNIITMIGPMSFDNTYQWNGALYYGAPWIEFNVTPVITIINVPAPATAPPPGGSVTEAAPSLATTEMASIITIVSAVMLMIAAIAVGARRKE